MSDAELARFIAHYERMTRWILEDEPADLIADIDERRAPFAWRIGTPPSVGR
jgi:D-glycerate 3-kinase